MTDSPSAGTPGRDPRPAGQPVDPVAPADSGGPTPADAPPPPPDAIESDPAPASTATGTAPPPPPPTGTATDGDGPGDAAPPVAERPRTPGPVGLVVAIGVGLLAAAIVLSSVRSRIDGDLDWSNYLVGLCATGGLLLLALVAAFAARDRPREELVTWPGCVGVLGVGAMLSVGLEESGSAQEYLGYLIGGVVAVLALLGYAVVRRGAFVVVAIFGLALIYLELCGDVLPDLGDEDDAAIILAAAIAVFVLVITAVGWLLPSRALSGVVVGVLGVVGFSGLLLFLAVVQLVGEAFAGLEAQLGGGGAESGTAPTSMLDGDFDNDVYVILGLALLLTVVWAVAAALTGHSGFTVLAIAMPAATVPTATFVLAVEQPTWWGVALGAAGGVLLVLAGLGHRRSARRRAGY